MDATRVRVIRQSCAPKSFPCPRCGTPGRRKDTHTRSIRDIAFGQVALMKEWHGASQLLMSQTFGAGGGSARALICDWNPTLR
jgi:hypothetical protein